jgi:hypothetical protein
MLCYGAVLDTLRQLGDGMVSLSRAWARMKKTTLEAVAAEWDCKLLTAKSIKGHFQLDWSDPAQRARVIDEVAHAALDVVARIRRGLGTVRANKRKGLLRRCRNLCRVVAQDLELDEDGRLTVATGVVADRLISQTDPEARHGRKSRSVTFNGFKLHLLGDVVSGFIASLCVTAGNLHDSVPTPRLVERAKSLVAGIERVLGDTAYGAARLRHVVRGVSGVEMLAPPPSHRAHPHGLGKQDFVPDFEKDVITCPQGQVGVRAGWVWSKRLGVNVPIFKWETSTCSTCPVVDHCCGKTRRGRRLVLHPYEAEVRAARAAWESPQVRQDYRTRSQCERLVNQMTRHGARRARRWGLGPAQLHAHVIALGTNLTLLARKLADG